MPFGHLLTPLSMRRLYFFLMVVAAALWAPHSHAMTELEERATIPAAVQRAFLMEDFAHLEEVSRSYRAQKSRTSSGLWKLTLFYAGIGSAIEQQTRGIEREGAFLKVKDRINKWTRMYPTSPSAHIALSMASISHGWAHRGGGYASTVKPEAWPLFYEHIAMARQNLERHKAVAATDPRWYELMLIVARAQSWDIGQFDALLNEALDREPLFYQTYFLALEYLLPKWHGGTQQIEAFAQDAARRTSKSEGKGMYARIYWYASQTQFQNDVFTSSQAMWPRMKDGFEDVVARYPDAWNFNNYAKFACLARDWQKARELLDRKDVSIVPEAWTPPSLRSWCLERLHQK
jgi:hypothetical protein